MVPRVDDDPEFSKFLRKQSPEGSTLKTRQEKSQINNKGMENWDDIWKSYKFRRPRGKAHELLTQTIHKVSDSSDYSSLRIPPWSQIQLKQSQDCTSSHNILEGLPSTPLKGADSKEYPEDLISLQSPSVSSSIVLQL